MGFKADVNLSAVDEFFRKWGPVFSVKFSYDDNKVNRGYGWVQFQDVEGATACIQEHDLEKQLKFTDLKGEHKITVQRFVAKGNRNIILIYIYNYS